IIRNFLQHQRSVQQAVQYSEFNFNQIFKATSISVRFSKQCNTQNSTLIKFSRKNFPRIVRSNLYATIRAKNASETTIKLESSYCTAQRLERLHGYRSLLPFQQNESIAERRQQETENQRRAGLRV
ncbi:unnamed protein product, partial [Onchocerca ochengi]